MERFAADPTASIPEACDGWGETIAAYRFLGNESVDWRDIMAPHWQQTRLRMQSEPVVLCLQDTTELNFNGQEIDGLGPLSYDSQRGMYLYPTYAVTPARTALGVVDAWMWAREKRNKEGQREGPKESTRWVEGYDRIAEMAQEMQGTRLVYVADREADLMPLMQRAKHLDHPADWLVRAAHNRCVPDQGKLFDVVTSEAPMGEISFTMASRHGVKERLVRQQLWARRVELAAGKGSAVTVSCISDASGTSQSGPGRRTLLRLGRNEGCLRAGQEAATGQTKPERSAQAHCTARRLPGAQRGRRTRCESDLEGADQDTARR